ncbi:MAG: hypothetical protein OEO79_06205 [Gemmatimonadota bacterium]|nr:hypothetical protein [Gemmatimonadota bacterium]MDH3422130.1 hypothetical protein [Gemmatimonadota bacterium]
MNHRMMVIFVDASHADDVRQILEACDPLGYSEVQGVLGKGATGRKLGTRAFPGSSTCFMAAMSDACAADLAVRLEALRDARGTEEGLKLYSVGAEELI